MKKILISAICLLILSSCSALNERSVQPKKQKAEPAKKTFLARITAYWPGEDYWTSKRKSSTGERLQHKVSAAVDPKIIPYGSTIEIPDLGLKLKACDTGSAVKSRKASRKNGRYEPVIDIFFNSRREAKNFLNSLSSHIVTIKV